MENRETRGKKAMDTTVPSYAGLFFDHLFSEYLALKPSIKDADVVSRLEEIHEKHLKHDLTWSNIYTFDLTLVDVRPPESLIRKAYDARAKYRSIAGQKEYDEYLAAKPPDLSEIPFEPDAQPPEPSAIIERALRADITYLLSKFYLYYALLPLRESLRDELTHNAVIVTGIVVVLIVLAIVFNVGGSSILPWLSRFDQYSVVVVTVATVTLAGIVGGCVSMLQRIQSAPSEGDALFNLAAMMNGKRGIMLSPIYGGIFASLLFVLFAAGILNGSVFPKIYTPPMPAASPTPSATPSPTPSATPSPRTPATTSSTLPAASKESAKSQVTNPAAPPDGGAGEPQSETTILNPKTPSPAPGSSKDGGVLKIKDAGVLQIKDFLRETGPADGVSYALLIIWSFLAGFAERLVPDTLNRLIAKNQAMQGSGS